MGIRDLSPELLRKAKEELGEDPARIHQDIQHIKEWAAKQPHLKARLDDQWLIGFLRGCKFSLEMTKEKLDSYYSMKAAFPEVMANKDPSDNIIKELIKIGTVLPLLKLADPLAPRVIILRPGYLDPNKHKIIDMLKVALMIEDINLLEDDPGNISGQSYILDLAKCTFVHLTQVTPMLMKKMTTLSEKALPFRQKGFHYINLPSGFETVFNFAKSFLNEKYKSRLHVHQNMDSLHKLVCKSILPTEYGGNAGPTKEIIGIWQKRLQNKRSWFLEEKKFGTNELKRQGSPKTAENLFGLDGSFRQLNLD